MEMHSMDLYIKSLLKSAGHRIRNSFLTEITIETKEHANDLVTNIDKEIEQFFISHIRKDFPDHRILGEEGYGDEITDMKGTIWLLDPIDGTTNFIHQKRNFAISLGVYEDGIGKLGYIYDVMNDDLYHAVQNNGAYFNDERLLPLLDTKIAESIIGMNAIWATPNRLIEHESTIQMIRDIRGMRSYGSAALEIAYVASGRLDAYISLRLSPWDIAGGMVIANEVGAIATNLVGNKANLIRQDTFIVANPSIHDQLLTDYIQIKK